MVSRFVLVVITVLLAVLAGCTTSNQESMGIGVKPVSTTAASKQPVVEGQTSASTNTQTALAAESETAAPAKAATNVASDTSASSGPVLSRVGFLPITGAPQGAVSNLSRSLVAQAKSRNIAVFGSNSRDSDYRLKGYMSALNEGSSTTVTYYWDVLDRSGSRLFRINGFEQQSGARPDPWAAVSSQTLDRIAERTMADLAIWLKRRGA